MDGRNIIIEIPEAVANEARTIEEFREIAMAEIERIGWGAANYTYKFPKHLIADLERQIAGES